MLLGSLGRVGPGPWAPSRGAPTPPDPGLRVPHSCGSTSLPSLQEGFGWTNGVALMLLDRYGDRLSSGTQLALLEPHCLAAALLLSFLTR